MEARPTINKILKIDIISNRAKELLNEDDYIQEFSHTVLHNKNIFKQVDHNYDSGDQEDEETIFTKQAKQAQENKASNNNEYDTITDTELFNQDPLQYVNNVIGGLKDKNILESTGNIKPMKKKTPSVTDKPKARAPKVSQWEIREQIAK